MSSNIINYKSHKCGSFTDSFSYSATDGEAVSSATIRIVSSGLSCALQGKVFCLIFFYQTDTLKILIPVVVCVFVAITIISVAALFIVRRLWRKQVHPILLYY